MSEKKNQKSLNIELPGDVARGVYSNLAIISHSSSEFILDFVQVLPGTPKGEVRSRIIMTPQHAKRLQKALTDNILKYEKNHGEVHLSEQELQLPPNILGPTGIA